MVKSEEVPGNIWTRIFKNTGGVTAGDMETILEEDYPVPDDLVEIANNLRAMILRNRGTTTPRSNPPHPVDPNGVSSICCIIIYGFISNIRVYM